MDPDAVGRMKNLMAGAVILRSEATKNPVRINGQGILRFAQDDIVGEHCHSDRSRRSRENEESHGSALSF
jgi:hypothetical protein